MIAVAFLYDTKNTWYREFPHVIAANTSHGNHVKVYTQHKRTDLRWSKDHNHDFDCVPLQLVRIANNTLSFDWLIVSDGDTCFETRQLVLRLKNLNHTEPQLLGHPMSPDWKGRCTYANCCNVQKQTCRPTLSKLDFYSKGLSRPRIWPYGGYGYAISKSLLNLISSQDWEHCERKLLRSGGDVRVASCIYSKTGIGLTFIPHLFGRASHHRKFEC